MSDTATPGYDVELTIDGVSLQLPNTFTPENTLAQSLTPAGGGRPRLDALYPGEGMPNVLDSFLWSLDYDIDDTNSATNQLLERLRTKGGVIILIEWKKRSYTYTARAGQQFFYLPRQDAFSLAIANHTTQSIDGCVVTKNGVAFATNKTVYKATVGSGDAVTADEVWIGNATVRHPDLDLIVAPFKFGTALALNDQIVVEYHSAYRVGVLGVFNKPVALSGREDKTLRLAEVA